MVESAEVWEHREGDDVPMTGDPKEFNEPAVEDRDPDMRLNAIQVENGVITSESSLELLQSACAACGILLLQGISRSCGSAWVTSLCRKRRLIRRTLRTRLRER